MSVWEIDLPESRGTSEGGAVEGDALDAKILNEPFDGIARHGDSKYFVVPLHTVTRLKRF